MSLSDKLKALKALGDSEQREKIMAAVIVQAKAKKAEEATAACIAEGLGEPHEITALSIAAGASGFLPLAVSVTADGETKPVESLQPPDSDFNYAKLAEDFNAVAEENQELKPVFLQKTAALLDAIVADNGVAGEGFKTEIL